jgi:hypothetical protein
LTLQDYANDIKPSNDYRIESESKICGNLIILDALSEVYREANEKMLMDEEREAIVKEIKRSLTERTINSESDEH